MGQDLGNKMSRYCRSLEGNVRGSPEQCSHSTVGEEEQKLC